MTTRLTPEEVLDHHYLEVRCKLLEIAAVFDRFQRADGGDPLASGDQRLERCAQALALLKESGAAPDRAERISLIFSDTD
jgi:hypothetical protein